MVLKDQEEDKNMEYYEKCLKCGGGVDYNASSIELRATPYLSCRVTCNDCDAVMWASIYPISLELEEQ